MSVFLSEICYLILEWFAARLFALNNERITFYSADLRFMIKWMGFMIIKMGFQNIISKHSFYIWLSNESNVSQVSYVNDICICVIL